MGEGLATNMTVIAVDVDGKEKGIMDNLSKLISLCNCLACIFTRAGSNLNSEMLVHITNSLYSNNSLERLYLNGTSALEQFRYRDHGIHNEHCFPITVALLSLARKNTSLQFVWCMCELFLAARVPNWRGGSNGTRSGDQAQPRYVSAQFMSIKLLLSKS